MPLLPVMGSSCASNHALVPFEVAIQPPPLILRQQRLQRRPCGIELRPALPVPGGPGGAHALVDAAKDGGYFRPPCLLDRGDCPADAGGEVGGPRQTQGVAETVALEGAVSERPSTIPITRVAMRMAALLVPEDTVTSP